MNTSPPGGSDFADRTVIVTGAGSGIGRVTAMRFAAQGANVVIADISTERALAVEQEITADGGSAAVVIGDLAHQQVVDEVVDTAVRQFGSLDILVNNAGIMDSMAAAADTADAEWERVLQVNLTAPFLLTRAALPHMLAAGRGAIVNTASEAALRGGTAGTAYTVSKHGLTGLTKSVAVMYRDQGIRANAVAPGATSTSIIVDAEQGSHGLSVVSSCLGNIGRLAEADEQAAVIVFLASDAASNISGVILPVDNGWSAA